MKLANQYIQLRFSKQGKIKSIQNPQTGREYLKDSENQMFRMTMSETYKKSILPGRLFLTSDMAREVQIHQKEDEVRFEFLDLDDLPISVTATIRLRDKSAEWGFAVKNKSNFAVKEIEYPWFVLRTPLGDNPESERFLVPKMDGVLLGNPKLFPWRQKENGTYNERYWYPGEGKQMPKNLSVQMTAYYDKQEGILIYAADPEGYPKRMGPVLAGSGKIDAAPVHILPEVGGLDFKLDYLVVITFFTGDWQQAARIYKEWSQTAPWCSRTIEERKDIPEWVKKGIFFLSFRLRYQREGERFPEKVPEFVNQWRDQLKMPVAAMMCGWEKIGEWAGPDYLPPYGGDRRFRQMCQTLHAHGNKAFPFGLSGLKLLIRRRRTKSGDQPELALNYDGWERFREQYIKSAALDIHEVPVIDSDIDEWDGVHGYACPATGQAMEQICGVSLRMLNEYGVLMQQADQVLGGGTAECYSQEHGHPPGRGLWQTRALRHIYDETRGSCKEINPDFILSQEWISEPFIQHLDIYHTRNYDKPQGGLESVPLFSFLYHEYIPCYAGDWTSFLPANKSGRYFHGWNFVCGNLPAGSPIDMLGEMENHLPEDADPGILNMAANACASFQKNQDFLVKGEMIATDPIEVPLIEIKIDGLDFGFERPVIKVPSVLHMFWKNPRGEIACAAANVSADTQKIQLPVSSYKSNIKEVFTEINGEAQTEPVHLKAGTAELAVEAGDTMMVFFEKRSTEYG